MPIPRNRYTISTGLALVMLLLTALTACFGGSGDAAKSQQTGTGSASAQANETIAVPTDAPTLPTADPTPPVTSAAPTALPQFSRLQSPSTLVAGAAPASQNLNGAVNVPVYLQTVMRSNRDIWRTTLAANGLQMPNLIYDVTSKSERYVSACTRGGKAIEVTADYGHLFYCSADNRPNGSIALPADVITGLWKGVDRKVADLAGAITVSRTSALILTASLQRELSLPSPESDSRQYMAACLSGVWAHGVYGQNTFTEKELAVAMEYSYKIGIEVDGTVASVDPTDLLITAWVVGFHSGNIGGCGTSYWR
jgi:hypothetical protein